MLESAGLSVDDKLIRVPGASNEVWLARSYVIRVSTSATTSRLQSEAALLPLLPPESLHPGLVAAGKSDFGDWIIVNRRPGVTLNEGWTSLSMESRRSAVRQLAAALKALHDTDLPPNDKWPLPPPTSVLGMAQYPHHTTIPRLLSLLQLAETLPNSDATILRSATAVVRDASELFSTSDRLCVVHGDFHLENALIDGDRLSALVDFEWSFIGLAEIDLDVLLRFCANPNLHVGSENSSVAESKDYREVPEWLSEDYPELFAGKNLKDRLIVHSLVYDVRDLFRHPFSATLKGPQNPLYRIRETLSGRSHVFFLNW